MAETKYCSSCSKTKPAGDFIHPRTGKDGATCAECIIKRSAAAKRPAPVDTAATLQLHTTRLDDHEGRIASVEETLYDYDAAGAPLAPDAPGAGDGTFTKSQLRRQRRRVFSPDVQPRHSAPTARVLRKLRRCSRAEDV